MLRKILLILIVLINLNAIKFEQKIVDIIGYEKYAQNRGLIEHIFSQKANFYINDKIAYIKIMEQLKSNGLLDLSLKRPQNITITFNINKDPIKSLKMLNNSLKSLGYYQYFTKKLSYDENTNLIWTISLNAEVAIDPLVLSKELKKNDCQLIDIKNEEATKWFYSFDTSNSIFSKAVEILAGERIDFRKPLKPYFLKIKDAKVLNIYSKYGNRWFPYIVFYDKHLNILSIMKEKEEKRDLQLQIPKSTMYIKIDDIFTLANIKHGLSVITKEENNVP